MPTSTIPYFFTGQMPFLPPNQQCQSTEGNKRIRIREKMLEFSSTVLPAPSPYRTVVGFEVDWNCVTAVQWHWRWSCWQRLCVTALWWLQSVKDRPNLAKCRCCNLITIRGYIFQHAKSNKHRLNAAKFIAWNALDPDSMLDSPELADGVWQ